MTASAKYILALDQGTTGSTVTLLDAQARMLATVNHEHPQIYPQPGWVEHDPEAIWQGLLKGIGEVFSKSGVKASDVAAIGITNQRETVVMWEKASPFPQANPIFGLCPCCQ